MSISFAEEERIVTHIALDNIVQRLSPKQKIVVALISAGYNRTECGRIMGLTRQAAGATYKRATKKIKILLTEDLTTDADT